MAATASSRRRGSTSHSRIAASSGSGRPASASSRPSSRTAWRSARQRSGIAGERAPHWIEPFRDTEARERVHALLLLASDSHARLGCELERRIEEAEQSGLQVVYVQEGRVRAEDPGHEHFGFKDGVSQPGIVGYTPNRTVGPAPRRPRTGPRVPRRVRARLPTHAATPGATRVGGLPGRPGARGRSRLRGAGSDRLQWAWLDGERLLPRLRRLRQDVPAFRNSSPTSRKQRESAWIWQARNWWDAMPAARHSSGQRIRPRTSTLRRPIRRADPSILGSDRINNFEFGADASGEIVPRAAHIRKVYPRNEATPGGGEGGTRPIASCVAASHSVGRMTSGCRR